MKRALLFALFAACGTPPPSVTVLAATQGLTRLYQTGRDLYAVDSRGGILRVPKDGSKTTQIAFGRGPIDDFIIDGDEIFFTQALSDEGHTELKRMAMDGSGVRSIWPNIQRGSLRSDGSYLYFYDRGTENISLSRITKAGGVDATRLVEIGTVAFPATLATDGMSVWYMSNIDGMRRVPVTGGASEQFLPNDLAPSQLTVDDANLYFLLRADNRTALHVMPKTGGTPTVLINRDMARYYLTPTHVIYSALIAGIDGRQSLNRVQRDGLKPENLIVDLGTLTLVQPVADESAVFFSSNDEVKRLNFRVAAKNP